MRSEREIRRKLAEVKARYYRHADDARDAMAQEIADRSRIEAVILAWTLGEEWWPRHTSGGYPNHRRRFEKTSIRR